MKNFWSKSSGKQKKLYGLLSFIIVCVLLIFFIGGNEVGSSGDSLDMGAPSARTEIVGGDNGFATRGANEQPNSNKATPKDDADSSLLDREIITKGFTELKVKDPVEASQDFVKWAESKDGFVESLTSNSEENYSNYASATVVVRLKDLSGALTHLRNIKDSEMLSEEIQKEDVTAKGADLDARIATYKASIVRLTKFMNEAANVKDLFYAEKELNRRQADLDGLTAQRKALTGQVSYNTLSVTFTSSDKAVPINKETQKSFKDGVINGWNGFVDSWQGFVYNLANLLPWLIIWIPLIGFGFLLWRRWGRKIFSSPKADSTDEDIAN